MNILDQLPAPKPELPIRTDSPLAELGAISASSRTGEERPRQTTPQLVSEDFKRSMIDRLDQRQQTRLEERASRALNAYLSVQQDDERSYMEQLLGVSEYA